MNTENHPDNTSQNEGNTKTELNLRIETLIEQLKAEQKQFFLMQAGHFETLALAKNSADFSPQNNQLTDEDIRRNNATVAHFLNTTHSRISNVLMSESDREEKPHQIVVVDIAGVLDLIGLNQQWLSYFLQETYNDIRQISKLHPRMRQAMNLNPTYVASLAQSAEVLLEEIANRNLNLTAQAEELQTKIRAAIHSFRS